MTVTKCFNVDLLFSCRPMMPQGTPGTGSTSSPSSSSAPFSCSTWFWEFCQGEYDDGEGVLLGTEDLSVFSLEYPACIVQIHLITIENSHIELYVIKTDVERYDMHHFDTIYMD